MGSVNCSSINAIADSTTRTNSTTQPSWLKNKNLALRDNVIRIVGLTSLALLGGAICISAVAATKGGAVTVFAGLMALKITMKLAFCSSLCFVNFFAIKHFNRPEIAKKTCLDLKERSFKDIAKDYKPDQLAKYGFITKEAATEMKKLQSELKYFQKETKKWDCAYKKKGTKLLRKNPNDPKANMMIQQSRHMLFRAARLETHWQALRDQMITSQLPEREIDEYIAKKAAKKQKK